MPEPARPLSLVPTRERQLGRALAELDARHHLEVTQITQQARLQSARIEAVRYVGARAMEATAIVSEWEQRLGRLCPLAVGRLQSIADVATLGLAEVLADTVHRVR